MKLLYWILTVLVSLSAALSGLAYLAEYVGEERIDSTILDFFNVHKLDSRIKVEDFKNVLEQCSDNELDWFFDEYVSTRKKIDYKIKSIEKTDDSITFTLKNKRGTKVPISLFGLKKDSVVSKYWFTDIDSSKLNNVEVEKVQISAASGEFMPNNRIQNQTINDSSVIIQ